MSEIDTVIAALVEYLYPVDLIRSSTSAVFTAPCILMTFSKICFNCFLPTWKSTSSLSKSSGFVLSTYPKSCGRISLNRNLPSVDSTLPVTVSPSGVFLVTLTLILVCSVHAPFSYARIASFTFLKNLPSPTAPGLSCVR